MESFPTHFNYYFISHLEYFNHIVFTITRLNIFYDSLYTAYLLDKYTIFLLNDKKALKTIDLMTFSTENELRASKTLLSKVCILIFKKRILNKSFIK